MFTGLIESVGYVIGVAPTDGAIRLDIRCDLADMLRPGDSLAVNGVCLTAVTVQGGGVQMDIGPETARITTLGALGVGARVNLERPMRGDGRFGGHFVQGHVDGTGTIERIDPEGEANWLTIAYPSRLAPYLISRGSVALDGVSLTVARLGDSDFDIMIIPFTWSHTNLSALAVGSRVNLECDMIGKYIARAAELASGRPTRPAAQ